MVEVGVDNIRIAKLVCYADLSRLGIDTCCAAALGSCKSSVLHWYAGVIES